MALCVKMSNSTVYYAVKIFNAIGEQLNSRSTFYVKKSTKKCYCTKFFFYTPQGSISTDKIIACLGKQPPCVCAGIIVNKKSTIKKKICM